MSEAYKRNRRDPGDGQVRDRRAQGSETRLRLLEAGLDVFAERGYHAARVDDIVRVAETSHGTFYLYFANKEELLRHLATMCAEDLRAAAGSLQVERDTSNDVDGLAEFVA